MKRDEYMYSWEIAQFLAEHNYCIGGDDLLFITDVKQHPQLCRIKYDPFNNKYEMWDYEGNYFCFYVIPYEEALEQGLVKKKTLKK